MHIGGRHVASWLLQIRKKARLAIRRLSAQVDGIDFIASGHTHTFMEKPVMQKKPSGKDTIIFQVGKSGINLGRVDFHDESGSNHSMGRTFVGLREASRGLKFPVQHS